jgi:hypothetical protein
MPRPFYAWAKSTGYQSDRRLGDNLRASCLPYSPTLKMKAVRSSRQGQKNFPFSTASRSALQPTQPPIQRTRGGDLSPGIKWPGHEVGHSSPSSAEVKNGRAIPPLPNTSLSRGAELIKHREDFILITLSMLIFLVLLTAPFPSPFVSSPLHPTNMHPSQKRERGRPPEGLLPAHSNQEPLPTRLLSTACPE